jgi:LssY-like putative type I secretion system component LssY
MPRASEFSECLRLRRLKARSALRFVGLVCFLSAAARPQTAEQQTASTQSAATDPASAARPRVSQEIQLTGEQIWVDTNIDVAPGEDLRFSASGTLRYADAKSDNTPDGLARGFKDLIRILPFNDAGRGALIGRIGDKDVAPPFLIGVKRDVVAPSGGRLSIAINQTTSDTGDGTYKVHISVFSPEKAATFVAVRSVNSIVGVDNSLFAKIPRRISDKAGNPGDMVNFLVLGSQAEVEKVFNAAGWVRVDADVKETVLAGFIASMSKESYLTMPMSPLYLFGRTQDYGWAHAEPIQVVASRNHLRLWRAPFTVDGDPLWVGAATHDIGFEHDDRSKSMTAITHKIDPDIDLERKYVEKTLSGTGQVAEVSHFLPENPMQSAKTATGGSFHSNGEVLILKLVSTPEKNRSAADAVRQ